MSPVIIGALCTPVTHAIMPVIQQAKVPLVIATSAGQDFVDASGVGGNDYAFKTIPSEVDIARGLMRYLKSQDVKSVAIVAEAGAFPQANAVAMAKAAQDAGMKVTGAGNDRQGHDRFCRAAGEAESRRAGTAGGDAGALHRRASSRPTRRRAGRCRSPAGFDFARRWPRCRRNSAKPAGCRA